MTDEESSAKAEAIRAIEAGFADELFAIALACSAPLYWYRGDSKELHEPLNNGTVFFVDGGAGPFCVTAKHVIEGYRQARRRDPDLRCQLANISWDPIARLIAEHPTLDIATMRIGCEELEEIGARAHVSPTTWPPKSPEPGKGIFFGGYPGHDRERRGDAIIWGFSRALGIAHSVRDNQISVQFDRDYWVCQDRQRTPPLGYQWGGASGGPMFTVVKSDVFYWRLAGVLTEFSSDSEILFACPISAIRENGTIA